MQEKKYPEMNEEEKAEVWDLIADELSNPKSMRRTNKEIQEYYGILERNFHYHTAKEEFMRKVIRNALIKGKRALPEILDVLQNLAKQGKEKSIEMYLEYVAELTKKMDLTTDGEKLTKFTDEQIETIARRIINTNKKPGE